MEMMEASVVEMSAMPAATTAMPAATTAAVRAPATTAVHLGACHPNAAHQQ